MPKKLELLPPPPPGITEMLEERLKELVSLLKYKQGCLEKAPEGGLHIRSNHGSNQYYLRKHTGTDKNTFTNTYIPKKNAFLVRRLAQKDYDKCLIHQLKRQIKWLKKMEKARPAALTEVYEKLSKKRQELVSPATLPDQQFAREWLKQEYIHKDFSGTYTSHFTSSGQQVRSKSEVLIAGELDRQHIPYRYEYPVEMSSGATFHPDFYCLNLATRQEVIWEHLGMCDSGEYAVKALSRLALYQQNGWHPGKNLILTFETQTCPLTVQTIRKVINRYFD